MLGWQETKFRHCGLESGYCNIVMAAGIEKMTDVDSGTAANILASAAIRSGKRLWVLHFLRFTH
jgi:acetyl-CoA acetyltransferase